MKFNPIYVFLIGAIGLSSCGSSGSDKDKNSEEFKAAEESLKQQIEQVVYDIPSPTEIPYVLQATGAEFNQSLLSARAKADQHAAKAEKAALNLGVFITDIGYLSSYDKTQEAIDYLAACKLLSESLQVSGSFDAELLKKFEANIANKDSLAKLLDNTAKKTGDFLKDESRNKVAALVITGSFVEGLFISTGLVKSYPKNLLPDDKRNLILTPIIQTVLNQKKSVTELKKMLSAQDQDELMTKLSADVTQLESAYAALNIEEQIKNNRADLLLTDKNLEQINVIVTKLRNDITE
jgi:hypothetical protein